jgi:hypothetical protein
MENKNINTIAVTDIKVTVQIPEKVAEHIMHEKINIIYDILKPKSNSEAQK